MIMGFFCQQKSNSIHIPLSTIKPKESDTSKVLFYFPDNNTTVNIIFYQHYSVNKSISHQNMLNVQTKILHITHYKSVAAAVSKWVSP